MGLGRKAIYFATDAIFAAMLILGGFYLIYQMTLTENPTEHIDYLSKDLLVALDQIPITAINHPFVQQELTDGNITNLENTVLEQIAEYWARGEDAKAEQLATIILEGLVPQSMGARLSMRPDTIYEQLHSTNAGIIASRRMISGIEKGRPLQGSSSYGYLRNIKDKRSSAYAYFGGFVGQGNITVQLEELPPDVNSTRIRSITLEADMEREFTILINDDPCANLTPTTGSMTADEWDLTACNDSILPGNNTFTVTFDDLNDAYVGGGYVRVDYETDYFHTNKSYTKTRYNFPEIAGVVNLYDAFHVPGNLEELEIHLHYHANHTNMSNTFYLTVGNTLVYADDNSTEPVSITLNDVYLSSLLNYALMSNDTVPFRVGFENLTYSTLFFGDGDVVVATDTSGSMKWNFTTDWGDGVPRNCDDPLIYDESSSRISVAKCLDKDFSTNVLNVSGNRVGLASYNDDVTIINLTSNITQIYEEIGMGVGWPPGYGADGSTCICCGINGALDLLVQDTTRTPYIVREEDWDYWNQSLLGDIPKDGAGREWYEEDYSLASAWPTGPAILGHDGGSGGAAVATELGAELYSHRSRFIVGPNDLPMDLWELAVDNETPEADFTSGLNSTANTYGIAGANDGWDWSSGTFNFAGSFADFDVIDEKLYLETASSTDSSGSFGVTVTITAQQYALINTPDGEAVLSFFYWWDDDDDVFEIEDQVWVKGRWTSPYSGSHLLGTDQDGGHTGSDATAEIAARDNPNDDIFNEFYSQDLAPWIEGPGTYYLELGGKLDRASANEFGYFSFDNILLVARNETYTVTTALPLDLWEMAADTATPEVEFTSGLNSTANTYGIAGASDGWDWSSGVFDYAGSVTFSGVWNNMLRIVTPSSGSGDVSGAYAVTVNITQQHYDMITSNGSAVLYFNYQWDDYQNYFENADQVWVKGRWTSPYTGSHWLGTEQDGDHDGADNYEEIAAEDNPNMDIPDGYFSQDLAPWIEGPGTYYLELGGKLGRSASNEWGSFLFDNILLVARNVTDHYYFRKDFTVASLDDVQRAVMNVLADDNVKVYLNGELVIDDDEQHTGEYWDIRGRIIDGDRFRVGTNTLAVELTNAAQSARFDLELTGLSVDREKVMLVMSDGVANRECAEQGWTTDLDFDGTADEPGDDAIKAACDAAEDYGVVLHSVGYSEEADEEVLSRIALCGNGMFLKSSSVDEILVFYQDVALQILEATRQSQSLIFSSGSDIRYSKLFGDSYVLVTHSSTFHDPAPSEIELVFQTPQFGACSANITIPQGLRVSDAKVISYSGEHWTSLVAVDDIAVFNMSTYASNYSLLGDPFSVHVPVERLAPGEHLITAYTADDERNTTGCSFNNSLIYTGFINSSTTRSTVVEKADGCEWTVEFEDGEFLTFPVPSSYAGARTCSYTNASMVYDPQDAYDLAVHDLLSQLDFDQDGRVFVNLASEDLEIIVTLVSDVPYLWGPAIMEVQLWQ